MCRRLGASHRPTATWPYASPNLLQHDLLPILSLPTQIIKIVSTGGRLPIPDPTKLPGIENDDFSGLHNFTALLQRCWAQNPADRPTFAEIVDILRCVYKGLRQLQSATNIAECRCNACRRGPRFFLQTPSFTPAAREYYLSALHTAEQARAPPVRECLQLGQSDDNKVNSMLSPCGRLCAHATRRPALLCPTETCSGTRLRPRDVSPCARWLLRPAPAQGRGLCGCMRVNVVGYGAGQCRVVG